MMVTCPRVPSELTLLLGGGGFLGAGGSRLGRQESALLSLSLSLKLNLNKEHDALSGLRHPTATGPMPDPDSLTTGHPPCGRRVLPLNLTWL